MAASTWLWKSGDSALHEAVALPAGSLAQLAESGGSTVGGGVGVATGGGVGWVGAPGELPPPPHTLSESAPNPISVNPTALLADNRIAALLFTTHAHTYKPLEV
jgi:hypothetical protein